MCWPVSSFQRAPQRFIRISNRLLQVASTFPVPRAKPSAEVWAERYRARPTLNGRAELTTETKKTINIESGALFMDLAQPNGRAAALLLNPRSPSSLFRTPEYAGLLLPNQEFFVYRTYKGATRSPP